MMNKIKSIKTMNKKGGFTDLFIFMIILFVMMLFLGVFGYIIFEVQDELTEKLPTMDWSNSTNATQIINDSIGKSNSSFTTLYWLSGLIIFGMILSIFMGSYLVTTKPVFFIPYIFVVIIAVIVSVPISNAYEELAQNAILSSSFSNFAIGNWFLSQLPIIISVVGILGGIIMFSMIGRRESATSYYGY